MSQQIINGDSAEVLKQFKDDSIDAVITDPPYGIEFLAKEWDRNTGAVEIWQECLRVLKPGGYLLAFSAARTYHNLATNIESVGFEIRDQIMWLYASGFPKAQDIGKAIQKRQGVEKYKEIDLDAVTECAGRTGSGGGINRMMKKLDAKGDQQDGVIKQVIPTSPEAKQWSGWKTALKPAHEPICMARKPFPGSTIDNVLEHGTGALNIDATRIGERFPSNVLGEVAGYQKFFYCPKVSRKERHRGFEQDPISHLEMVEQMGGHYVDAEGNRDQSRSGGGNMIWLPHLGKIYTHGLKHEYEQWCKKNKKGPLAHIETVSNYSQGDVKNHPLWDPSIGTNIQRLKHKILEHNRDLGPKASLAHITTGNNFGDGLATGVDIMTKARSNNVGNNHPTVKPVALMKYLVKLVTPQGAHVLDPFCGSGSTGMACKELARQFTGIDLDNNYCAIARRRIRATHEDKAQTLFE